MLALSEVNAYLLFSVYAFVRELTLPLPTISMMGVLTYRQMPNRRDFSRLVALLRAVFPCLPNQVNPLFRLLPLPISSPMLINVSDC